MTSTQITRLALWGGLALFLTGVLSCGAGFAIEANDHNPYKVSALAKAAFALALFLWAAGIIVAIAGALLKAFKRGPT